MYKNCYFCNEWVGVNHYVRDGDNGYKCPGDIVDSQKHLQPHELSAAERAVDNAFERNRLHPNPFHFGAVFI